MKVRGNDALVVVLVVQKCGGGGVIELVEVMVARGVSGGITVLLVVMVGKLW